MDSFYDFIWDVTILEYLTRILGKISCLSETEKLIQVSRLCSSTVFRYSPQTRRNREATNCCKIQITKLVFCKAPTQNFQTHITVTSQWVLSHGIISSPRVPSLDKSHRPDGVEHQQPGGSAAAGCAKTKEEILADDGQAVFLELHCASATLL